MSNKFETARNTIVEVLKTTVIKVSDDQSRTCYTWSFDKICSAVAGTLNIEDSRNLPDELKSIVRFEFNKFRDSVLSDSDYVLKGTTDSYALTIDGVESRRNVRYSNDKITLEKQLTGALVLLDKTGIAVSKAKNQESSERLVKRQRRLLREIAGLRLDIAEKDKALLAAVNEANIAGKVAMSPQNGVESVVEVK